MNFATVFGHQKVTLNSLGTIIKNQSFNAFNVLNKSDQDVRLILNEISFLTLVNDLRRKNHYYYYDLQYNNQY